MITPQHLRQLAVVYIRQSTEEEVLENTGSTDFQRTLAEIARSFGWPESQIQVIDEDLGKSGSSIEQRSGWRRLQNMIDADQVGAIFVANISRLSRQVYDFEIFRLRAALHHTLLYSDGRLGDPANLNDAIVSQVTAMVASFVAGGEKNTPGNDSPTCPAGDASSSTAASSDCRKNTDREKR
ncbi:MAG: recombinase family protein [Candidatus Binatia bacterium]